jgi:hypothetical protein
MAATPETPATPRPPRLAPVAARVLFSLLIAGDGVTMSGLVAMSGLDDQRVLDALCDLEAAGYARPWAWQLGPMDGDADGAEQRLLAALRRFGAA